MSNTCFDAVPHENLEYCPNDETSAGIATKLFYVPIAFIKSMQLPDKNAANYEDRVKIPSGGIVLKTGKSWKAIDILRDEGELKSSLMGNTGNKKSKGELEFLIPGLKGKQLGFVDAYKNTPCVYAVRDQNGQFFILGNNIVGAYIDSADGTTGKKIEDNSGITAKISANTKVYTYEGEISLEPAA